MKKLMFGLVCALSLMVGSAFADETAPVNDLKGSWDVFKEIVNRLEPKGFTLWNIQGGDFYYGSSIDLYRHKSFSASIGYARDAAFIASIDISLNSLTDKCPDVVILKPISNLLGEYAFIGFGGGKDFSENEYVYGPEVGVKGKM